MGSDTPNTQKGLIRYLPKINFVYKKNTVTEVEMQLLPIDFKCPRCKKKKI